MNLDPAFIEQLMGEALREADDAFSAGEVPVGAIIARNGKIVGRGRNRTEHELDCSAHAEMLAIRAAGAATGGWRLSNCVLCVTLEPCTMCLGAIRLARIPILVFGAWDEKMGACGSLYDLSQDERLGRAPRVISSVRAAECEALLKSFFKAQRERSQSSVET